MKTPIFIIMVVSVLSISFTNVPSRSMDGNIYMNCHKNQCKNKVDNNLPPSCYKLSELDIKPRFNGEDITSFSHWINQNITMPESTQNFTGKHKVITSFIIMANGHISNVSIIEGFYPPLDSVIVELINNSPNWEPGYISGQSVNCQVEFPIFFEFK